MRDRRDEPAQCRNYCICLRVGYNDSSYPEDGENCTTAGIPARRNGYRGRMAGQSRACPKIGRRASTGRATRPGKNFFATSAFCSRVEQAAEKRVACPCHEFSCAALCAYFKENSQYYG